MANVNFAEKKLKASGIKNFFTVFCGAYCVLGIALLSYSQNVKLSNVAGAFYPENPGELSADIDSYLADAQPQEINGSIFALINPHAGYEYSGEVAAYGYKLIRNKPYTTVVIIAPSHYYGFKGVSVYAQGAFRTPLGDLQVDSGFTKKLLYQNNQITFDPAAFQKEHALEVQLPFLQKVLTDFKIVPIIIGQCDFLTCQTLALLLKNAIGERKDVLIIASSDMYHGYDYREAQVIDALTLSYLKKMDARSLFVALEKGSAQMCGGLPVVTTILTSQALGHKILTVLHYTNSAEVTGKRTKGVWTVGYSSSAIDAPLAPEENANKREGAMLDKLQRKKLLEIARNSIETYLKTGKKPVVNESDEVLRKEMGAFVTLRNQQELRGCIGNMIGHGPLYLTVRNMAIEAATGDPRFPRVLPNELAAIEIEISALSPLKRVASADEIELGVHGVLIKKGFSSGVFLPQVATETGWTKNEFLSNLCTHKAGLPADAWKDKATEIFVFTAEVFSEKEY